MVVVFDVGSFWPFEHLIERTIIAVDGDVLERLMDLSRFDAAPLIAFTATKEIDYWTETDGRIPPGCVAYRIDKWADA